MFDLPTFAQLPIGLAIGVASVIAPWLLRPFIVVAVVVLCIQGGVLYAAGGSSALMVGLSWFATIVRDLTLVLAGIGIGRWGGQVLFGR